MEEGKKVPFSQVSKQQSADHFNKLDYIKVKIVYHHPDKTSKTAIYKCSSRQQLQRIASCLRITYKLKQHESLFFYLNRRIVDQKKTLSQIRLLPCNNNQEILVFDAATSDIF